MSETMASLRQQIDITHDLQSVVTTMRALASVNIRQYQESVVALEEYRRTIELGIQIVLENRPQTALQEEAQSESMIAVIVGSDQGLVGQFNRHVVEHFDNVARDKGITGDVIICAVGLRLAPYLEDMGYDIESVMQVPGSRAGVTPTVGELLVQIADWRQEHRTNRLSLFYNRPTGQATYEPRDIDLLPLNARWLADLCERSWESRSLPTSRVAWVPLFRQLIQQHFFASIYFSLVSSLASENASRLASMESAKDNIEERLEDLQQRFNHRRQQSITEELFDVIAGFELLSEE